MQLIDANNAARYLYDTGRIAAVDEVVVRELSGGVSNLVLLVSRPDGEPCYVLKQAREQLRVPEPWFCSVRRIWREIDVLEESQRALSAAPRNSGEACVEMTLPRVLFSDRDSYLFAMTAAPPHEVWKQRLLAGHH